MNISRTTVAEIYKSARYKMADSVVNGKQLLITGGNYQFCDGMTSPFCKKHCNRAVNSVVRSEILKKEGNKMRIAVTYEAVSYTHLDVYKRQHISIDPEISEWGNPAEETSVSM